MRNKVLQCEEVVVNFDGFLAVNNLDFSMEKKELHFLIGPNGAGKTTFLDVLCGKVKPVSGKVLFKEDVDLLKLQEHERVKAGVGRKFQAPSTFSSLSVFENLEIAMEQPKSLWQTIYAKLSAKQKDRIDEVVSLIGLEKRVEDKAGSLSHGQKQWLEIGMVLVQNPELFLLDEPIAGMTEEEKEKTGELLLRIAKERSVIVVEHDMDFVRNFAEQVTVMHEGSTLCVGSMKEVQRNERVVEVYLGKRGDDDVKDSAASGGIRRKFGDPGYQHTC